MNVSPISRFADRAIGAANRFATKAMDSKVARTLMPENPTDVAKLLALISTTTKDMVNCYYYTTQSYNNKRIPEDKRKFVAGIDLANGILNVVTQLSLGLVVNKMSDKMYDRIMKGGLVATKENVQKYKKLADELLHNAQITSHITSSPANIEAAINKANKVAKAGFGVISVLVVTQIIAKRMIVPFLSTPLAGFFKKYLDKKEAQKGTKETNNEVAQNQDKIDVQNKEKTEIKEQIPVSMMQEHKAFKGFEAFLTNV